MGRDVFYITSSIPYVNAEPHVGTAYEIIACDFVARYRRLRGDDVWFLTGTDEHSINVARSSAERNMSPQEWVDQMVPKWAEVWRRLEISNDDFIRTSEQRHADRVQAFVQRLHDRGEIYLGTYRGPYCVSCEEFKQEKELIDGNCAIHGIPVEMLEEENYFFPLSKYQEPLLRALRGAPRLRAAGLPPQRGGRVRQGRAPRPLHLSIRNRLGHPGSLGPEARHLRVGRRVAQLRNGYRVRHRAGDVRRTLAGGPPCDREGHRSIPRGDLAGAADGGGRGGPADRVRARVRDDRRREDVEESRHRRPSVRAARHLRRGFLPVLLPASVRVRQRRRLHARVDHGAP